MEDDATPGQKKAIAIVAGKLGIREPIEEKPMSFGEAGRLYRELSSQLKLKRGSVVRPRRCRHCGHVTSRTAWAICSSCGRFQ